jgi:hypothetical protein
VRSEHLPTAGSCISAAGILSKHRKQMSEPTSFLRSTRDFRRTECHSTATGGGHRPPERQRRRTERERERQVTNREDTGLCNLALCSPVELHVSNVPTASFFTVRASHASGKQEKRASCTVLCSEMSVIM